MKWFIKLAQEDPQNHITGYHTSNQDFTEIDPNKIGWNNIAKGHGVYMGAKPEYISSHGPKLYEFNTDIHPKELIQWELPLKNQPEMLAILSQNGGIEGILPNPEERADDYLNRARAATFNRMRNDPNIKMNNADLGKLAMKEVSQEFKARGIAGGSYFNEEYVVFDPKRIRVRRMKDVNDVGQVI